MTREEAIKRLKVICRRHFEAPLELNSREDTRRSIQVYIDAIDMAIEALEQVEELEAEMDVLNWTIEKLSKERPKGVE